MKFSQATLSATLLSALFICLFFFSPQASHAADRALSPSIVSAESAATLEEMLFVGIFTNTAAQLTGNITIELTLNDDDTIVGTVEFIQNTRGFVYCGSGEFEGTKTGDLIELQFTSENTNPACGLSQGATFTIEAALENNTHILGSYTTDRGEQGTLELRRVFTVPTLLLPIISTE